MRLQQNLNLLISKMENNENSVKCNWLDAEIFP